MAIHPSIPDEYDDIIEEMMAGQVKHIAALEQEVTRLRKGVQKGAQNMRTLARKIDFEGRKWVAETFANELTDLLKETT